MRKMSPIPVVETPVAPIHVGLIRYIYQKVLVLSLRDMTEFCQIESSLCNGALRCTFHQCTFSITFFRTLYLIECHLEFLFSIQYHIREVFGCLYGPTKKDFACDSASISILWLLCMYRILMCHILRIFGV